VRVNAAAERVSTVDSPDTHLLIRACYHLGNRHVASLAVVAADASGEPLLAGRGLCLFPRYRVGHGGRLASHRR
jgi:hypothetical protein